VVSVGVPAGWYMTVLSSVVVVVELDSRSPAQPVKANTKLTAQIRVNVFMEFFVLKQTRTPSGGAPESSAGYCPTEEVVVVVFFTVVDESEPSLVVRWTTTFDATILSPSWV
jgi:hypothetical protein